MGICGIELDPSEGSARAAGTERSCRIDLEVGDRELGVKPFSGVHPSRSLVASWHDKRRAMAISPALGAEHTKGAAVIAAPFGSRGRGQAAVPDGTP
jgi:hypothetical protein